MKNIYLMLLALLCLNYNAYSQTYDYTEGTDILLAPINKSYMNTGTLYDRVYPMASLNSFNQTGSDTSNCLHFLQSYSELYRATYSNSSMTTPGFYDSLRVAFAYSRNIIPIGVFYFGFDVIDPDAISNGQIYQGSD